MTTRRPTSVFLLVLLTSALFVSIYSITAPTPAVAAIVPDQVKITLMPNTGPVGTWVTFSAINITGYNPTLVPSTCSLLASHPNFFSPGTNTPSAGPGTYSCFVVGTSIIGSFKVRDQTEISLAYQLPGLSYNVTIQTKLANGTIIGTGWATFRVTPRIGFSLDNTKALPWPSSIITMPTGQTVYVRGWGYNASSTYCVFHNATLPDNFGQIATTSSCSINAGELTGQFVTSVVGSYPYVGTTQTINATGNWRRENATGTVTITSGPAVQATPAIGTPGMTVGLTGMGFSLSDSSSCTLSYTANKTTAGVLWDPATPPTCQMVPVGTPVTWKQPVVSFVIAASATPKTAYYIRVTGSTGDYANTTLRVPTFPAVVLTPTSGPPGQTVQVTTAPATAANDWHTTYTPADTGLCTMTSNPAGLISSYVCLIDATGALMPGSSFTVSLTSAPGGYSVIVTGSKGDYATGLFVTALRPTIALSPSFGSGGDTIQISGVRFHTGDTLCTVVANRNATINPVASWACSVTSGTVSASFTIKTLDTPAGHYNVTVYGNTFGPGSNDWAYANITVRPKIVLSQSSARVGTNVTLSGSNFASTDWGPSWGSSKPCSVASLPTSDAINRTAKFTPSCRIDSHYTIVQNATYTSSFLVAANPTGSSYTIMVTGTGTPPPSTAPGQASASLSIVVRTVVLSPDHGPGGTWVTVLGTGFSSTDTICTLRGAVVTSSSCSIAGGNIQGMFQATLAQPLGSWPVNVTAYGGPQGTGDFKVSNFVVTPAITILPTTGNPGTIVTVTGSAFSAADTSCTISSDPTGLISNPVCTVAGGVVSGSFTVASGATGAYKVIVRGSSGDTAEGVFNRATPTLTLTPASGVPGTIVDATGGSYLGTSCIITATPSNLFTVQACLISAGNLTGTFTVASGASGPYTVLVQTNAGPGDSKQALFTVGTATTTTTATTAMTTSTAVSTVTSTATTTPTTTTTSIITSITTSPTTVIITTTPTTTAGRLTLSSTSGQLGSTITFSGSGYTGTTCSISSVPAGLLTSTSCSISGGTLTGSFRVSSTAPAGIYTVTVATNFPGESSSATFTVSRAVRPCIIATATFGSELSPAVQFLRNFRDGLVLSTRSGSAFMEVFNAWYYSFSPSVAGFIAGNDPVRAPVRALLYPLLSALGTGAFVYSLFGWAPELAVLMAGLVASSLIGLVYLTPVMLICTRAVGKRRTIKVSSVAKGSLTLLGLGLLMLTAGEMAGSFLLLAAASSAIVLTCVTTVPLIAAIAILRPRQN